MPLRLKSLEIQGYKTFANSTVFEFSETVTAIVGPNGSGKSNIVDALRWVLGEQSYSLLRGKKTEDMIFSGSEQRSRSGMAFATVTFDNSDSWLPIDFSEVAVTRRAYRDGQNEYLLNGQRVRLRDVSELLAESGLAERTYTVIGQGLVDAALSLKAEERRRLFEEAAGIGLHRSRREESFRRLENTQRNLERVQDILSELHPRLKSLERQARRSREYEQVKDELRELLRIWYGYHWNRAQKELSDAKAAVRDQEISLDFARKREELLESQLDTIRNEIQVLRSKLSNWYQQLREIQNEQYEIERDLAISGERQHYLELQRQDIQNQIAQSVELVEILGARSNEAREDIDEKEALLTNARDQLVKAEEALDSSRSHRDQTELSLEKIGDAISEINNRKLILEAKLKENQAQLESRRDSRDLVIRDISNLEKEIRSLEQNTTQSEKALRKAQDSFSEIQDLFLNQQEKKQEIESGYNQIGGQVDALKTDEGQLRARLDTLEQIEQTLTGFTRGTRVIMNAAQQMKLSGVQGILNQQIEVHADLEVAIKAALGEFLEAVILTSRSDIEPVLNLLTTEGIQGAMLPLDSLETTPVIRGIEELDGVVGVATNYIRTSQELRPLVDSLLNEAIIVRDRKVASRVLKEIKKRKSSNKYVNKGEEESVPRISGNLRVVTLTGEVFFVNGPILSMGRGDTRGLGYSQQLQELSEAIDEKSKQVQLAVGKFRERERELDKARAEIGVLGQREEDAKNMVLKLESAHSQNMSLFQQTKQRVEWQKRGIDSLDKEIRDLENVISEIPERLNQFEEEYRVTQSKLSHEMQRVRDITIDEKQKEVADWNTRIAVLERDQTEAVNRYSERLKAFENEKNNYEGNKLKVQEIEKTLKELNSQRNDLQLKGEDHQNKLAEIQSLIDPSESELKSKESDETRLSEQEHLSRQSLNVIEHQYAQSRIKLAGKQEALESLRKRIQDDFGLVDFEYVEEISGPKPLPFEGIVEQLPLVKRISPEIEDTIKQRRAQIRRMGSVNPEAQDEYQEVKERFEFLTEQTQDLEKAQADIRKIISDLNTLMEEEFRETFSNVADEFHNIFSRLFGGGTARLVLTDPDDLTSTGIDIEARLPGRREQGLSLLSGGERSLTATALVFSLLRVSPTPFCVLDEVDAMLDEANVGRYRELLRELSESTQFIIVTHNRNTVQVAEVIYGVTMSRESTSQVISLKMDEVGEIVE
jgi:chromosome segregation protein